MSHKYKPVRSSLPLCRYSVSQTWDVLVTGDDRRAVLWRCRGMQRYFPSKKCRFLSGHCSWAINEMTSGQWERRGRKISGRREGGGSGRLPFITSLTTEFKSFSYLKVISHTGCIISVDFPPPPPTDCAESKKKLLL